jgi:uroporphyrinogen III methyltransferase / synthase
MNARTTVIKVGARGSGLSQIQTRNALEKLRAMLPGIAFEETFLSSPGDRDRTTDLRESPADFFTRDLDEAVLSGELDCAVHSAKDVPDPVSKGLDWFWLPWREDPCDAIVLAPGRTAADLPPDPVAGISSERREDYCRQRFPGARFKAIRGNIERRLAQVDSGEFDFVIMAACALVRLGIEDRISERIPLEVLPTPDGQGALALTFKAGNPFFLRLRGIAARAVTFAGGGVGEGMGTVATMKALARCDVCMHDTLLDHGLLDALPSSAVLVNVGKRCGSHSVPQPVTTELITTWARRGARVVRLKGGDPCIFGRLAEEVEALDALHLPYRVLPGVSSLSAAASCSGILPTRRGVSRGFCAMSPRVKGGAVASVAGGERAALPVVFFMAISSARDVVAQMLADGEPADTPAAMVLGAGTEDAAVVRGTLADICDRAAADEAGAGDEAATPTERARKPGLFIVGSVASYAFSKGWGALEGQRVLLTCSETLQEKAAGCVMDFGGVPVRRPLIRLDTTADGLAQVSHLDAFDWVVLTSPSSVRCFADLMTAADIDIRRVPKLLVCGAGTARELAALRLHADARPESGYSSEAVIEAARPMIGEGCRVLRLRSEKAGPDLAEALRGLGAEVEDCLLYGNRAVGYDEMPRFDAVFFASASAVEAYASAWGAESLEGKTVLAIGRPTLTALRAIGIEADVVGAEATVESSIRTLAEHRVRRRLGAE